MNLLAKINEHLRPLTVLGEREVFIVCELLMVRRTTLSRKGTSSFVFIPDN